jgi:hypothetical protein
LRQAGEEGFDLVALEELRARRGHPFARDRGDPLGLRQRRRCLPREVGEEGVQSGEALVARANVIATLSLEMAEELSYALRREILDRKPRDGPVALAGDEGEEQPERVAISS